MHGFITIFLCAQIRECVLLFPMEEKSEKLSEFLIWPLSI